MTLADKLTNIAKNIPKVYSKGIESYAMSAQDYLIGTVSGNSITITDISSVEHLVDVKVKINTEVDLLTEDTKAFEERHGSTTDRYVEWVKVDGVNTNRAHAHTAKSANSSTAYFTLFKLVLEAGSYTFKADTSALYVETRTYGGSGDWIKHKGKNTITLAEKSDCNIRMQISFSTSRDNDAYGTPQLIQTVYSTQPTPIRVTDENGISTEYMSNENGIVEGVKSVYPTMNITTDVEDAVVYAKYVKDLQKAAEYAFIQAYTIGRQAEYDLFWDNYQQYGARGIYSRAFGSKGWNNQNFKPKYDIICNGNCEYMFAYATEYIGSLPDILNGKKLDTSKATNLNFAFAGMYSVTYLPRIDLSGCGTNTNSIFTGNPNLKSIEEVVFNEYVVSSMFSGASSLTHVRASGIVARSGYDLHWSTKLDKESIESAMSVLSDSTSGLVIALSLEAVNKAFETAEGLRDGSSSAEWLSLANTKKNWTIKLL